MLTLETIYKDLNEIKKLIIEVTIVVLTLLECLVILIHALHELNFF